MVDQRPPRLELTWPNKDNFLLVPKDETGKPIWVGRDHPAAHEVRLTNFTGRVGELGADPHADNLLFTGDSLDVLRVLREVPEFAAHYRGRIKLIYIDPPFNTGQTFTHYDDWMEHSTWLSFMRDRLLLAKDLLAPDGSIWVHLDDVEQHRMRCLMDEVFGADRFVATVVWQKKTSRDNRAAFSQAQDYILIYAMSQRWREVRNRLGDEGDYANPDDDPRGAWRSVPMTAQAGHATPSQFYTITTPTGVRHGPPSGRCWTYTEPRFHELVAAGRVYWPRGGDGKPRLKRYPDESNGLVPFTLWPAEEVGDNPNAVREIRALFGPAASFDTPKPERLLHRVIHIASNPGDIVLDCFAGSGTTAAVAHKMGRRWVSAELSAATVAAFTEPRLREVVAGEDPGGVTAATGWSGGGGFRTVTVDRSLYEVGPGGVVLLGEDISDSELERAMCGQLGFTSTPNEAPFAGRRGRMRLAVIDGFVGPEEARHLVSQLSEGERVTIAATAVLPGVEDLLSDLARGSRVRKIPRDVLAAAPRRRPVPVEASER